MALGIDNTVCKQEFLDAMRDRLQEFGAEVAANVDTELVGKNLGALGQAVFRIATARAEVRSNAAADAVFWQWMTDVNNWLTALSNWQQGVAAAFTAWAPVTAPEVALRTALTAVPAPPAPPAAPASLRGAIV